MHSLGSGKFGFIYSSDITISLGLHENQHFDWKSLKFGEVNPAFIVMKQKLTEFVNIEVTGVLVEALLSNSYDGLWGSRAKELLAAEAPAAMAARKFSVEVIFLSRRSEIKQLF